MLSYRIIIIIISYCNVFIYIFLTSFQLGYTKTSSLIVEGRKYPLLLIYDEPYSILRRRIARAVTIAASTISQFYSPFETLYDSEEDKNEDVTENPSLNRQDREYVQKGQNTLSKAVTILFSDGWIRESSENSEDVVESKYIDDTKVFRMQATLETAPDNMMAILYDSFEIQPNWNPTVRQCKIIKKIDDNTDITYTISAPACKGMVTSRDFVILRHRAALEHSFVIASVSIETYLLPENNIYIRAENGPSCFIISPVKNDSEKCELRWLINTNLNGWLPKQLVNKTFTSVINDFLKHLRKFIGEIPKDVYTGITKSVVSDSPDNINEE
ncbi:steroidogenic acute regulatory protein, mitochondrial-like [Lycorma delicatula]|uniref:steroidogenic acute regulatory protein, mitochondrial-like n=1 Tax=Lycorma delicatula TaxID=130591 RepID=UPI003F518E7B